MRNKKTTDKRVQRVNTRTTDGGVRLTPVFHREKVRVFSPGPRRFKEKTSSMTPIVIGFFSCRFFPFLVKKKITSVAIFERSIKGGRRRSAKASYDLTAKAATTRRDDETFAPDYTEKRTINFNATYVGLNIYSGSTPGPFPIHNSVRTYVDVHYCHRE